MYIVFCIDKLCVNLYVVFVFVYVVFEYVMYVKIVVNLFYVDGVILVDEVGVVCDYE